LIIGKYHENHDNTLVASHHVQTIPGGGCPQMTLEIDKNPVDYESGIPQVFASKPCHTLSDLQTTWIICDTPSS